MGIDRDQTHLFKIVLTDSIRNENSVRRLPSRRNREPRVRIG